MKTKTFFTFSVILFATQIAGCKDASKDYRDISIKNQKEDKQTIEISSAEEKESIRQFIAKGIDDDKKIKIKCKLINSFGLKEVSSYRFFQILIFKETSKGSFAGSETFLAKKGDVIVELEAPKQNGVSMPLLIQIIDRKIKIKNNDDANIFFDAFSVLHRNFRGYLPIIDGRKKQEIVHNGNDWIFVFNSGVFDREAFIVKTDNDGVVLDIIFDVNPSGGFFKENMEPKVYPEIKTKEEAIYF